MEVREYEDVVVSGAMAAVLRASRFAGIAPLRFCRLRRDTYRASASRSIFIASVFVFSIVKCITVEAVVSEIRLARRGKSFRLHSTTGLVLYIIHVFTTSITTSLGVYGSYGRIKRLLHILNRLREINACIEYDYSSDIKAWKIWAFILSGLAFFYGLLIINLLSVPDLATVIFTTLTKVKIFINVFASFVDYGILGVLQFLNVVLTLSLKSTMETFNCRLKSLYTDELEDKSKHKNIFSITKYMRKVNIVKKKSTKVDLTVENYLLDDTYKFSRPPSQVYEDLTQLSHSYLSFCDLVNQININGGSLPLLMIVCQILKIFINVYHLTSMMKISETSLSILISLKIMPVFIWLPILSISIMSLIEPSHRLLEEMESTKILFSQLLCRLRFTGPQYRDLETFFQQFLLRSMSSSHGILTFKRPLIATIAGLVTTFIIIILQFNLKDT